ncbi:UNVERIFIED_CONTAM: hypothetical protein FKN15_073825 [Acipenser sinensis]
MMRRLPVQGIDAVPVLPTLPVGVKVSISLLDGRGKSSLVGTAVTLLGICAIIEVD